jgi:hypothetical protein
MKFLIINNLTMEESWKHFWTSFYEEKENNSLINLFGESTMWGHSKKMAIFENRRPCHTPISGILNLTFLATRTVRNNSLVFMNHSVYGILLQHFKWTKTSINILTSFLSTLCWLLIHQKLVSSIPAFTHWLTELTFN